MNEPEGCPSCNAVAATWITNCENPIHATQANAYIHQLEKDNGHLQAEVKGLKEQHESNAVAYGELVQQLQQATERVRVLESLQCFADDIMREAINELKKKSHLSLLTWSTAKPTTPGWYWWRINASSPSPSMHELRLVHGVLREIGSYNPLEIMDDGHWCGPLTPPQEAGQ